MPVYEFVCARCGERFDVTRRIAERHDPAPCPGCGTPASRVLSGFAVAGAGGRSAQPRAPAPSTCSSGGG